MPEQLSDLRNIEEQSPMHTVYVRPMDVHGKFIKICDSKDDHRAEWKHRQR